MVQCSKSFLAMLNGMQSYALSYHMWSDLSKLKGL